MNRRQSQVSARNQDGVVVDEGGWFFLGTRSAFCCCWKKSNIKKRAEKNGKRGERRHWRREKKGETMKSTFPSCIKLILNKHHSPLPVNDEIK